MDEEYHNGMTAEEHRQMEEEAKALTKGCGCSALLVAAFLVLAKIIFSLL